MKKTKILSIVLIVITLLYTMSNTIYASAKVATSYYDPSKQEISDIGAASKLGANIVAAIRTVGIIVAVVGLIAIGIKFMIGSVEEKAEYKKSLLPYFVGCIMIFTITTVISIIYDIVTSSGI